MPLYLEKINLLVLDASFYLKTEQNIQNCAKTESFNFLSSCNFSQLLE